MLAAERQLRRNADLARVEYVYLYIRQCDPLLVNREYKYNAHAWPVNAGFDICFIISQMAAKVKPIKLPAPRHEKAESVMLSARRCYSVG